MATVILSSLFPAAIVGAEQPLLILQPIQIRGDTLHHADTWDVQYSTLPELRLAALPDVPGPESTASRRATPQFVPVRTLPTAGKTALEPRTEAKTQDDMDFAKGLGLRETESSANARGRKGELRQTVDDRVAPAEFYQQNADQQIPRPSYLESDSEAEPPTPSYLDSGDEQLTFEQEFERLKQRVFEIETAQTGHEDATRSIIRRSFAEQGANINDFVIFGGTLETLVFWEQDFDGVAASDIVLDTAELDFEIQVNPWTLGSLVVEYFDGSNFAFPTAEEDEVFVDRINVRQAFITVGDVTNYPPFATFGRAVVPFGISTGDPVADVLTIVDPLTVEVFETHEDFVMIGFVYPICCPPPLDPNAPPGPPPIQGVLINPLVRRASTYLFSYYPCTPPPKPPTPLPWAPICPSPYSGAIYFYNGDTIDGISEDHIEHFGGTLGYQTRGVLPYRSLPWSVDLDVDVNSSVFDSDFLQFEYRRFLNQIGYVPGMAAHAKMNVGPTAWVLEWNGALMNAEFIDDVQTPISIRPRAWQIAFAYQFGWHRLVEIIGVEGTYFTMGYSESQDLAGATRVVGTAPAATFLRVGNVPEKRLSVGVGEWVMPGLRVALEYSRAVDYSVAAGGTGNSADAFLWQMTYEW